MNIKIFKDNNKDIWYYAYTDSGKRHKKICRNCKTKEEAQDYVSHLKLDKRDQYKIKNIAKNMYLENSEHIYRLNMFGKKFTVKTLNQKRSYIELIMEKFGEFYIDDINFSKIEMELLIDSKHSGSWKNGFLETFGAIYDETAWICSKPIPKPKFQRFVRNSKKADILTTEEIKLFLDKKNWKYERDFILYNIILFCGLRLGEARALRVSQFIFEKKILVVDGFLRSTGERTDFNKMGNTENKKIRIVPLPDILIDIVKNYINFHHLYDNDFIFTRENGKPLRQEYLESVFKRVIQNANISLRNRKLVPHSLRYTYVTRLRRFLPVDLVQQLVGHSDSEMTNYYTKFGHDELLIKLKDSFDVINTALL